MPQLIAAIGYYYVSRTSHDVVIAYMASSAQGAGHTVPRQVIGDDRRPRRAARRSGAEGRTNQDGLGSDAWNPLSWLTRSNHRLLLGISS